LRTPVGIIAGLAVVAVLGARSASAVPGASPDPTAAPAAAAPRIVCVGTSLTAGLGLDPEQAWPALLQAKVDARGWRYRVVNAGVSGETSAGALRRMDWLMREKMAILILETGANDGLRGQEPEATRANIGGIFERARRQEPPPLLVLAGMQAPPNLGADYTRRFRALFPEVARTHGAALVPFLLEGVGGVPRLNQADGIHPTADGQRVVAENVWRVLEPLLSEKSAP